MVMFGTVASDWQISGVQYRWLVVVRTSESRTRVVLCRHVQSALVIVAPPLLLVAISAKRTLYQDSFVTVVSVDKISKAHCKRAAEMTTDDTMRDRSSSRACFVGPVGATARESFAHASIRDSDSHHIRR